MSMRPRDCEVVINCSIFPKKFIQKFSSFKPEVQKNSIIAVLLRKTGDLYSYNPKDGSRVIVVSPTEYTLKLISKKKKGEIVKELKPWSVVIYNDCIKKEWSFTFPDNAVYLYQENKLPIIYSSLSSRVSYGENIRKHFCAIKAGDECVKDRFALKDILGKGCYGNIYKYCQKDCAVKVSKMKEDSSYKENTASWHEVYILKEIIKPILKAGICPNLPLLYDYLECKECILSVEGKKVKTPCVVTIVELAEGNLRDYIEKIKPNLEQLLSCLFQIFAGLSAIQAVGQIMNYDIKKENILYYKVKEGYLHYRILEKDFYVPTYGYLFVINDFGISRPMSPNYPIYRSDSDITYRLGSRYAIIDENKSFVPIDIEKYINNSDDFVDSPVITWGKEKTSKGAEFQMYRENGKIAPLDIKLNDEMKKYLKRKGIPLNAKKNEFFLHPNIIPPFEFYNDTQDGIRMFTGGKRTTQKGNHRLCPELPKKFIELLKPYVGKGKSHKDHLFSSPQELLASYFIISFFSMYEEKPTGVEKFLGSFSIS